MKKRPSYLVEQSDIERMMTEYRSDPEAFLRKFKAGPSTKYDLLDRQGRRYPPAAIYQAAAGWDDVRGGLKAPGSAGRRLRNLGFRVVQKGHALSADNGQIAELLSKLRGIVATEIETRRLRRIGATDLRKLVIASAGRCEVSGIADTALLVVSHIESWASNEANRLDPDNVILLSALWDVCFDRGLVSFGDGGQALYGKALSNGAREALQATERYTLVLTPRRRTFLAQHRLKYGFPTREPGQ